MKRKPSSATIRRARDRTIPPPPTPIHHARVARALENTVHLTEEAVVINLDPLADALRAFAFHEWCEDISPDSRDSSD